MVDNLRLEDVWQSHCPLDIDPAYRTSDDLTANLTDEDNCRSYSITNARNGDARAYLSR